MACEAEDRYEAQLFLHPKCSVASACQYNYNSRYGGDGTVRKLLNAFLKRGKRISAVGLIAVGITNNIVNTFELRYDSEKRNARTYRHQPRKFRFAAPGKIPPEPTVEKKRIATVKAPLIPASGYATFD